MLALVLFCVAMAVVLVALRKNGVDLQRQSPVLRTVQASTETSQGFEQESVVQGELSTGEPASYKYLLNSDEYLHFTVEQKGIDLSLTLLDTHGKVLVRSNNNRYLYGPERLSWIAEQKGTYILRLEAGPEHAFGTFELRVDGRRPARPEDQLRIKAEQLVTAGLRYNDKRQPERALEAFQAAEKIWSGLAHPLEQANVLDEIGDLHFRLGAITEAMEAYEHALKLNRDVGSKFQQAISLIRLGDALYYLARVEAALGYYQQVLPLARDGGDLQSEGAALRRIGMANLYLGNFQSSFDSLQEALAIIRRLNDRQGEVKTLFSLGAVYESLNENERALELWKLALIQSRTSAFRELEIDALLSIGKAYSSLGNSQTALEYFKESLSQSQKFPNVRGESQSLFNLGEIYSRISYQGLALKYYKRASILSRKVNDDNEEALVLSAIGAMQESAAEYSSAVRSLNEALVLNRRTNNSKAEAQTLYLLARVKAKQGTIEESLKDIEAALDITESKSYEIQSQTLRAAYAASTQQYYDLCIDLLMQLEGQRPGNGFATLAFQVSERRKARILYDLLAESSSNPYKSDPELLEQERSVRELLSAKMAYQMSILGHELKRTDAEKIAKEIDLLKLKYQELQARVKQVAPKQSQPQLPNLSEIQRELTDDTILLEYALGADRSYVWAITSNSVSVYELPPSERIEKVAREVYRLLQSPSRLPSQSDTDTSNVTAYWQQATALSQMVLGPVARELNKTRLLVAGDGVLHFIPFAALPAPYPGEAQPLIADHEIVNLPSASVLVSLRRRNIGRQQPTKAVAVIADPVFERDDPRITSKTTEDRPRRDYAVTRDASPRMPRLFYAEREASEILALSPSKQSVAALGLNATREFVLSGQLNSYSVIHFATHGMNNSKDPELSGIALSMFNKSGEPENGLLQLHDIYSLRLSADLVVLSSCDTALGKNFPGEGPLGLTQGFMASGAQSVLSTLWKVDDEATAEFMRYFYKGMMQEGLKPAAALRNAQFEMRQQPQWQAPFYWAGFILQGDWNQDVIGERQNATAYVPELPGLLTLGVGGLFLLFNNTLRRRIRAR